MRLTPETRDIIRHSTQAVFGLDSQVKLFGSRIDDRQRGGDIDLLVELPRRFPIHAEKASRSPPVCKCNWATSRLIFWSWIRRPDWTPFTATPLRPESPYESPGNHQQQPPGCRGFSGLGLVCWVSALPQPSLRAQTDCQGFISDSSSIDSKSRTFLVAKTSLFDTAIAAIWASSTLMGRPIRLRSATILP